MCIRDSKTGEWWAKIVVYTGVGPRDRKTIEAKIDIVDPVTEYTLTMSVVGSGMTDPSVGTHTYEEGSVVGVEAFANSGWSFDEWSGDKSGSTNPTTITMSRDKSVTAHFTENGPEYYTLTVNTQGCGDVTPSGGTYEEGATVTLTADPCTDWKFDHWSGDATGATNPKTITMNSDKSVTAHFTENGPEYYTLTVNTQGSGTVSLSPSGGTYESGTVVTLTAIPDSGWSFSEWSGDKSGSTNPTTITMSRDKSVTAHFNDNTDPIEADAGGPYVAVKDEVIQFSGSATGGTGSYDWHWDFGDDTTSNKKNPSHTYSKAKLYTVTLTVTDGNGNTASESVNAAIGKTYTNKYAIVLRGPSDPNIANGNDEKYLDWAYDNMQMCLGVNGFQVYNLYQPDLADFNAACQSVSNKADKDDLFILVMMGHGIKDNGVHKFYINDRQYESERLIEETRIPAYINNIKCQQVVVMFSCHSGGFLDDLSRSDNDIRRIVITSSKKDEVTYGGSGFLLSLMNGFLSVEESDLDGNGIVTIEEIFRYASNSIDSSLKNLMHPLLDDNGDTEGHTIYDVGYTQIPNDPGKDGFFSSITTLDCGPSFSSTPKAKNKPTILTILRFLQGLMDRFSILEQLLTMPLIFNRILN